jgi:outer membrane protein OmpA-like peptidoglycan-associated protein
MNVTMRTLSACTAGLFSLTACATQSQMNHGLNELRASRTETRSMLDSERVARLSADSAQAANMQREVASLRTDLTALRTEFGVKIAEVAQGLQFAMPVHFAYNDATVRTADSTALNRFANVVQKHYPGAKITVEGFADPAGSASYNRTLSQRRADAVKQYVTTKGIDPTLINTIGYGKTRLVNSTASRDMPGAELNRRVVFVIETPGNTDAARAVATTGQ